ncbi:SDR family oxidoreductase [Candidatus Woesearchaeota archaeon]|nr:SDR family oxidoreductase [Candidatus Woesearchaeota archaeon]
MKKTALVTGGAGFIGRHLCSHLLSKGFRVVCMDNFITGSKRNIEEFSGCSDFEFIRHDVTEYIDFPGRLDYVLHFASPASPADYLKYPIQTLKVGGLGTHNALGLAKDKKAVFMLASTSEVYGDPLVHPQSEEYWGNVNPIGPRGVYDEAKRFAEALSMAYHRTHKVDVRIARIFNTFGPFMRLNDGRAVPNFIWQALNNKPLTVFGDGSQTRSFCYISDLVDGIYSLLMSGFTGPVNLGNSDELTILEFARRIVRITGSRSEMVFEPLPQDDPKTRRPDLSRARKLLGWEPNVSLEDGLFRTIEWFRAEIVSS